MQNYTRVVGNLNVSRWHFTRVSSLSAWCIGSPLYGGVRGGLFLSRYKGMTTSCIMQVNWQFFFK